MSVTNIAYQWRFRTSVQIIMEISTDFKMAVAGLSHWSPTLATVVGSTVFLLNQCRTTATTTGLNRHWSPRWRQPPLVTKMASTTIGHQDGVNHHWEFTWHVISCSSFDTVLS